MSHPFHEYLAAQLDRLLQDRRVVVFYDPRTEFEPFIDELTAGAAKGARVGETPATVERFDGSFFALRATLEEAFDQPKPEPLLVYVPGVERDRNGSVLMELECAGAVFGGSPSHGLRGQARRVLLKKYTDGDIDEMLASGSLSYGDVVEFLEQSGTGPASLVRVVLGNGTGEHLLTRWLATDDFNDALVSKLAVPELYRLVQARLGLELLDEVPIDKARQQSLRYVLVNEFRSDLACDEPGVLGIVAQTSTKEETQRVRTVASGLRAEHGDAYIDIADDVEQQFGLATAELESAALGAIDTFRFEERRLLGYAAELIIAEKYDDALELVALRGHSFWLDHPKFLNRLAQWEACRLIGELGKVIERVGAAVKKMKGDAGRWVEAYATPHGWHEVDRAQRAVEAWVAGMEQEPEEALEQALGLARRKHEALLKEMSKGFTEALIKAKWNVGGVLQQTRIYPEVVEPAGGRVAYFFVDALRFEMGADLVDQLQGGEGLVLQPAVAVLPSITPLGMAALLPGASASYSVVEHNGKLASQIGDKVMPGLGARMKYLRAVRPDAVDIDLGELLQKTTKAIQKKLDDAQLVVVRSQSIDGLGEMDGGLLARQIMDTVVGNVARAVRKLSRVGFEYFVITSDHGHQFSIRKDDDMKLDKPGGDSVDQHRRCWAGHGGQTTAATVRVSGAQLGYQTDLDFIFPRGLAVFKCGGDLAFHHGGISLQEMVVPVVSLRMPTGTTDAQSSVPVLIEGYPVKLTNRTFGFRLVYSPDMFEQDPCAARILLIGDGQEVGRAGMAPDVKFDRTTATAYLPPRQEVSIGMMLTSETSKTVRIVVQDPATDAVLAQSEEIEVGDLI